MSASIRPTRSQRRARLTILLGILAVAGLVVAVGIALSSHGGDTRAAERATRATIANGPIAGERESAAMLDGVPQEGISLGRPDAPVRFVEFADLQCPACREYALNTMPLLVRDYVRTGKVRMEFRNLAFLGRDSVTLGRAASAAARQNRLWNFLHVLYFNQGEENSGYATPAFVDRILAASGVDSAKANAFAASRASTTPMTAAGAMARRHGIDSTPSFLVGRADGGLARIDAGANDAEAIASAIDDVLAR